MRDKGDLSVFRHNMAYVLGRTGRKVRSGNTVHFLVDDWSG